MNSFKLAAALLFSFVQLSAQTGPNSPSLGTNNAGTGTIAWTSPGNCVTSNDVYSSVATSGITNYLYARTFGFAIAGPA
ncbi:MAG: hypothetical protein M3R17_11390, partial [Bacteroidota bacterium]|nr:hypothetical protein [Bacteroidota bacterium]